MGKKKFVGQEYTAATDGKGLKEDTAVGRFLTRLTVFLSVAGILVSVAVVAFTVFFMLSPIIGTSMMKTLNATGGNTDSVLTNKLAEAKRGDIIITKLYGKDTYLGSDDVIDFPHSDANGNFEYIIKRLIALPGDTITVDRVLHSNPDEYWYYIRVNGQRIDESGYLDPEVASPNATNFKWLYDALNTYGYFLEASANVPDCIHNGVLTVPEGYWFYMGDNRGGNPTYGRSWDCASFGPQPTANYVGRGDDVLPNDETVVQYLWGKFKYYVLFGWTANY